MNKYEIIINSLTEDMKKGLLKEGDQLPSVRSLATKYQCNKDTVLKALSEMTRKQLIYSIPRSGHYVLKNILEKENILDFKASLSESAQIPFEDFNICLSEALHSRDNYLFSRKASERGLDDLLDSFYRLLPSYSVYAKKTELFVANGAQQALYILSQMAVDSKKNTVIIEQPTYHRMNRLIKNLKLPYQTITRNLNGIDLNKLEELFAKGNIKFFYTIARLHYPLGIGYTEQEKIKIVELANKYDVYIIEDDYMADFDNGNSLPLHYYDISDKVIYIKSFSSIVFNSLRLALVVLPHKLIDKFSKYKTLMDYDTNLLLQKAMSIYIDNGMFYRHRNKLIALYSKKNIKLIQTLNQYLFSEYSVYDTKTIFKVREKNTINRLKKALSHEYQIDFLEDCYIDICPYEYITIDVKNMVLQDIEDNLQKLLAILDRYL